MERIEHLLTIAGEECNEIAQRCSKALRFGLTQVQERRDDRPEQNPEKLNNKQRIEDEFQDLIAALDMLGIVDVSGIPHPEGTEWVVRIDIDKVRAKQAKVEHYLKMSDELGTLTRNVDDPDAV